MRRALAVLCALAMPALCLAAPVSRSNFNSSTDNSRMYIGFTPDRPVLQLFMNNLDRLDTLSLWLGGRVAPEKQDDWLRVRVLDGCLNEVFSRQYPLALTLSNFEANWFAFNVGVALQHGRYYYLELSTRYGGEAYSAQLGLNNSRYEHGRMFTPATLQSLEFTSKKDDVKFMMSGLVEETKAWFPEPTTNVLCPGRCQVVGTEKTGYGLRNQFNVVFYEAGSAGPTGSFWADYQADPSLSALKENFRRILEDPSGPPASGARPTAPLAATVPYNAYYNQMNFYVAVENPATDPRGIKGFLYCANADARIIITTGAVAAFGYDFGGEVARPPLGQPWDYDYARGLLQHELLGHGIGQLTEEYITPTTNTGVSLWSEKQPNADAIGCPSWCGAFLTVNQVITQMAADPNAACWNHDPATCQGHQAPGNSPRCLYLGGVSDPSLAWFGGRTCVPYSVTQVNIGLGCTGNSGCYIGRSAGSTVLVNQAAPGGDIMGAGVRASSPAAGFTTPIENHIRDVMDCFFPLSCYAYPQTRCDAFQAKWSPGSGRKPFGYRGNACESGYYRRR